jgi:hypothetical protein
LFQFLYAWLLKSGQEDKVEFLPDSTDPDESGDTMSVRARRNRAGLENLNMAISGVSA